MNFYMHFSIHFQFAAMTTSKASESHLSLPPIDEKKLSPLPNKGVAAHPWHDLEMGIDYHWVLVPRLLF